MNCSVGFCGIFKSAYGEIFSCKFALLVDSLPTQLPYFIHCCQFLHAVYSFFPKILAKILPANFIVSARLPQILQCFQGFPTSFSPCCSSCQRHCLVNSNTLCFLLSYRFTYTQSVILRFCKKSHISC